MRNEILIVFAVFAAYRLAHLITVDDGPWFIFQRVREWTDLQRQNGKHVALNEAVYCAYCIGVYTSILSGALLVYPSKMGNLFLIIFGLAGMQSILQRLVNEKI